MVASLDSWLVWASWVNVAGLVIVLRGSEWDNECSRYDVGGDRMKPSHPSMKASLLQNQFPYLVMEESAKNCASSRFTAALEKCHAAVHL